MTINYLDSKRLQGLSTDTKPTNVQTNLIFEQTDNSIRYWYNGTNWFNNPTRGVFAGGSAYNVIDYVTISTTGNATDFGDLLSTYDQTSGCNSDVRGLILAGSRTGANSNSIEYITIATTGNSTDFGDRTITSAGGGQTVSLEHFANTVILHNNQDTEHAAGIPCAFGKVAAMFEVAMENLRRVVGQNVLKRLLVKRRCVVWRGRVKLIQR